MSTQYYRLGLSDPRVIGIVLSVNPESPKPIKDLTGNYYFEKTTKGDYTMFSEGHTDRARTSREPLEKFKLDGLELELLGDSSYQLTEITEEEANRILKDRKNPDGWREFGVE